MKKVLLACGIIVGGSLVYLQQKTSVLHNKSSLSVEPLNGTEDHLLFTSSKLLNFREFSNGNPMVENINGKYLELINDFLVFNLKSFRRNDDNSGNGGTKATRATENISSGTCFVISPIDDPSTEYIYLLTAAHCVVTREGCVKKVILIPKKKEGMISNQQLERCTSKLIECQIVCCEYDGDRDVDFAIMKCLRNEFLEKNEFRTDLLPHQYFIPKIGEFKEIDKLNNMVVGYPSKYKEYRDERAKDINFELMNRLMMTFQKKPVFSLGRYLRTEKGGSEKANISIFTNTINKGLSGGPSCNFLDSHDVWPKFHGIVTLFHENGYGSFDVSNQEFKKAYFAHVKLPSSTTDNNNIKKIIEEYRNN